MRTGLLRHGVRAVVAALVFAAPLGGTATADATARGGDGGGHASKRVEVTVGASGIQAPQTARAGLVSFHVKTDDTNGRSLQAFRPHQGVTVEEVLADLAQAVGEDPSAAAEGISAVRDKADLFGGAHVAPSVPETFTTPITAGPVVLLDFSAFLEDQANPVTHTLQLSGGKPFKSRAAFPDSIVITKDTAAGPRFDVNGLDEAKDNILVYNASREIHEVGLQRVNPGTTDAQIQAFFDGTDSGPPPFDGPFLGLGAFSPDRAVLLETHNLPPGTYVLICFVPGDESGVPHVIEGMHKVVELS